MEIIIQPIEKDISNDILNLLSDSLSTEFNNVNVIIAPTLKVGIQNFINRQRNQLKSPVLLHYILEKMKPTKEMKVLVICDMDAYSGELNFIFGEAQLGGRVATIYLARLKPEFYDLTPNELVFYDRVTKEAVHELGHSFGLFHCNNKRCVMHFSNSLYDTDFKNRIFCKNCKNKL
ncbi:MAG: archaemetzincin family Zn-dependent metalloprotease [Nitrososphaeraceae archaeon]|nr:archaemetzincin family Zn-dependent metalloprotease [Nitrososphaeraceae archaeon]